MAAIIVASCYSYNKWIKPSNDNIVVQNTTVGDVGQFRYSPNTIDSTQSKNSRWNRLRLTFHEVAEQVYYLHVPMQDSEVRDNTKMYQKQFMTTLLPDKVLNINNHSAWAVLNICITVVFLICLNTLPCIAADACSLGIFCLFLICCDDLLLLLTNIVITLNNLIFFFTITHKTKRYIVSLSFDIQKKFSSKITNLN